MASASDRPDHSSPAWFVTTHWSVVMAAGDQAATDALPALNQLCRTYWYPLYTYVRRSGHPPHDAQDLIQEFFARLLQLNWVAQADRARGRFRTFLLVILKRFLANEWDKVRALKRGGGQEFVRLDFSDVEGRYQAETVENRTPEQIFERRWALTLLDEVLRKLEAEERDRGKQELFGTLKPCLLGRGSALSYAQLAQPLGMSEAAVKVTVHRLRSRYRELIRAEIASTVTSLKEVDSEMRHLFHVLVTGSG